MLVKKNAYDCFCELKPNCKFIKAAVFTGKGFLLLLLALFIYRHCFGVSGYVLEESAVEMSCLVL